MRILIVTSVQAEAEAIGPIDDATMVVSGIGRTNAAAATTEAIIRDGPYDLVICTGVAGVLPEGGLSIAETIVATACIYFEEGVMTPSGFEDIAAMGFDQRRSYRRHPACRASLGGGPGHAVSGPRVNKGLAVVK